MNFEICSSQINPIYNYLEKIYKRKFLNWYNVTIGQKQTSLISVLKKENKDIDLLMGI